jgi:predicted Zn-dependent protease
VLRPVGSHRVRVCVRLAACARSRCVRWHFVALALCLALVPGCASLRRRAVPTDLAAARDLTQQGVTAMEMGYWSEAEKLLEGAAEASPVDAAPRRYLAEVLWHRGATKAALVQMEKAVEIDADDSALVVRYGEMLLGTGDVEKSLERANQAIMLNPKLASAWALRGRAYWRMNQTDRALADLQRSLQFAPDTSDVLMDIAAIYRQRGQHDRCLTTLQHLLDTYPPGQGTQLAYWMEGLTLSDLGRPVQAVDSLRVASQKGPANADILYYLAQAQLAAGQPAAATLAVQEALAANPSHVPSRRLLTELAALPGATQPIAR